MLALYSEVSVDFEPGVTEPQLAQLRRVRAGHRRADVLVARRAAAPRRRHADRDVPDDSASVGSPSVGRSTARADPRAAPCPAGRPRRRARALVAPAGRAGAARAQASPARVRRTANVPPVSAESATRWCGARVGDGHRHQVAGSRQARVDVDAIGRRAPGRQRAAAVGPTRRRREREVHQPVVGGAARDAGASRRPCAPRPRRRAPRRCGRPAPAFSSCEMRSCRAVSRTNRSCTTALGSWSGRSRGGRAGARRVLERERGGEPGRPRRRAGSRRSPPRSRPGSRR